MTAGLPHAARIVSRSHRLVQASIAVIAGLVLASAVAIWSLRADAIAETEDDNYRLGVVIAEQTARSFQSVDFVLQAIADRISASDVRDIRSLHEGFGARAYHEMLIKSLTNLPEVEAFTIVDSAGRIVNGSRQWPPPDYSLAYQDYFRYLSHTPDPGPYISEPGTSHSSGARTVFLARRLAAPDGTFLGVAVTPILLSYFSDFFATTRLSNGTGVTILRRDGITLVRFPAEGVLAGTRISANVGWHKAVAAGGGHYRSPGAFANVGPSYVSVHPLRIYPVVVDITRKETAALARWRQQAVGIGLGTVAATITLALLVRALGRQITLTLASQDRIGEQMQTITANEERLAAQSTLLRTTLDNMSQGLLMVDAGGAIAVHNPRALEILHLPEAAMEAHPKYADIGAMCDAVARGTPPGEMPDDRRRSSPLPAAPPETLRELFPSCDAACQEFASSTHQLPDGRTITVCRQPVEDGRWLLTYEDITERHKAQVQLDHMALHDALTNLPNRAFFRAHLERELSRMGNAGRIAVIFLDLDRFKNVNDTLGHQVGDMLLQAVAGRLQNNVRETDIVARLGGDEFAVVQCNSEQPKEARSLARRLVEVIGSPFDIAGHQVLVGVSLGIALAPADGIVAGDILKNADLALYRAKAEGRGTYRFFEPAMDAEMRERHQLELDLRRALMNRELTVYFQPLVSMATGRVTSFEALLRWQHPTRGLVLPGEFIPLAEEVGLIVPIGEWVLMQACKAAAGWPEDISLAVNISGAQFRNPGLAQTVMEALGSSGLAGNRLEIELTESVLMQDTPAILETLQQLRAQGIRVSMDDFGTGYSSLSYLRLFPFDKIKIDQSFVRDAGTCDGSSAIVRAIVHLGQALGMTVTAEGIETAKQLDQIRTHGCAEGQGFLFSKACSADEVANTIARINAIDATADSAWRTGAGRAYSVSAETMAV